MGVVDSTKNKEALQGHEKNSKTSINTTNTGVTYRYDRSINKQGHSILSYVRIFEQKLCSSKTTLLTKLYFIQFNLTQSGAFFMISLQPANSSTACKNLMVVVMMMMMMMMMMNCFRGNVDHKKPLHFNSGWHHYQKFSPSQIYDPPWAGLEFRLCLMK